MLDNQTDIDQVSLQFGQDGLLILNIILALIMFGIALPLRAADFRRIAEHPISVMAGLFSQLIFLPALTIGLILIFSPPVSIAFGMLLVACCPGGNTSNFITYLAGGNTALSVTLTAFTSTSAWIITPLNFAMWGALIPDTEGLLKDIELSFLDIGSTVLVVLVIPLFAGMYVGSRKPLFAAKMERPVKWGSLIVFFSFIVFAFISNFQIFLQWIPAIFVLVLLHNGLAMSAGYLIASIAKQDKSIRRTLAIETGIQNAGLGLLLIFQHFDGIGGMAVVAAWWGVWHLVSGIGLASWWSVRP